jgi:pyruvate,water dikinase
MDEARRVAGANDAPTSCGWLFWLGDPRSTDPAIAGGKGAGLGRMIAAGLPVPPGFVVGADAFRMFVSRSVAVGKAIALLGTVDGGDAGGLARASREIRDAIRGSTLPDDVAQALTAAYEGLGGTVAVRSSAIAEDSPAASYAGQQQTYLDVGGAVAVIARVKDCWASFFSEHAMFYRQQKGSLADVGMAVVVQRLVEPEKAGVMFTIDPIQRRRDRMVVEAVWGFGEALVSGQVTPDNYQVARSTGRVLRAFVPPKPVALRRGNVPGELIYVAVSEAQQAARVLDDAELGALVALGARLEEFFGSPRDVEWAIVDGTIYLLQSRPITTTAGAR